MPAELDCDISSKPCTHCGGLGYKELENEITFTCGTCSGTGRVVICENKKTLEAERTLKGLLSLAWPNH